MKSFKELLETRYVATADYTVSPTGRKIRRRRKVADTTYNDEKEENPKANPLDQEEDDNEKKDVREAVTARKMVETSREDQRLWMLARLGLLEKSKIGQFKIAMQKLHDDKIMTLSLKERTILLSVFEDMVNIVTGDDAVFNRMKVKVQESTEDTHEISIRHGDVHNKNVKAVKALVDQHKAVHSGTSDKSVFLKVHDHHTAQVLKKELRNHGVYADHYINGESQ